MPPRSSATTRTEEGSAPMSYPFPTAAADPVAPRPGEPAAPDDVPLASRFKRLVAVIVNALLTWGVPAVLVASASPALFDPLATEAEQEAAVGEVESLLVLFWICAVLIVQGVLLASRGQTIGKILLRVRIVRVDGSRASGARLIGLRVLVPGALGVVVPFFGLIDPLFIVRSDRRTVHDLIADTKVVVARPPAAPVGPFMDR